MYGYETVKIVNGHKIERYPGNKRRYVVVVTYENGATVCREFKTIKEATAFCECL